MYTLRTVHTACVPAPHNHSQHNQCRTPYAAVHTLGLLMMGIMIPKTRCDRSLTINIKLFASCWFLSLHPNYSAFDMFRTTSGRLVHTVLWYFFHRSTKKSGRLQGMIDTQKKFKKFQKSVTFTLLLKCQIIYFPNYVVAL